MAISSVLKRDGQTAAFDRRFIVQAITRAQEAATGKVDAELAAELAQVAEDYLFKTVQESVLTVEAVQDAVIYVLQESGNYEISLAYSRYRDARERQRRQRMVRGELDIAPNLKVVGADGRRRQWDRDQLRKFLVGKMELTEKAAQDVVHGVEEVLADTDVTDLGSSLLLSIIETMLVRYGMHASIERCAPLRVDRQELRTVLQGRDGLASLIRGGQKSFRQLSLAECFPPEVLRHYNSGRLWIDGINDPARGSEYTVALDGDPNPWQIISHAFSIATAARRDWQNVRLIVPPLILDHLERGAEPMINAIEELADMADVYLYCDGRTPLLDSWPFKNKRISLATYAEDFLLLGRLQELGLKHLSGPHLMKGGYSRRVAVKLAINAQGIEDNFNQMDLLAMSLVAAAKVRMEQLSQVKAVSGADIRFAIFGLSPSSSSIEYLEREVVQEGLRCGTALSRSANLPDEACRHLGKLFS